MARTDYYQDPDAPTPNSIKVAVSALVCDDRGRILMIHRTDNGKYSIPGGGLEAGETVGQAVVREVKEETGTDVEVTGMIGVFSDPNHVIAYDDGEVRQEFSICFYARPVGGELRTSDESSEVRWVAVVKLSDFDIHPSTRLRIAHGLHPENRNPYFNKSLGRTVNRPRRSSVRSTAPSSSGCASAIDLAPHAQPHSAPILLRYGLGRRLVCREVSS